MKRCTIKVDELAERNLVSYPVWEFVGESGGTDETAVYPIERLPVDCLDNRIVGTRAQLANGAGIWLILGELDLQDPFWTLHFRLVTVLKGTARFTLARYHDLFFSAEGPMQLAQFLGLNVADVFPIRYDISTCCNGKSHCVVDQIPANIDNPLKSDEKMEVIMSRLRKKLLRK